MTRGARVPAVAPPARLMGAWLLASALCCHPASEGAGEGRLSVHWTGSDTATFSSAAAAEWCASLHLLEIRAIAGDTGAGIVLYPADTVGPGVYPVRRPDVADTSLPPSAAVALRWASRTMIMGYQADSGRVTVERTPDARLAGRFSVHARPLSTGSLLKATGSFEHLRIVTAPASCAGRQRGDTAKRDTSGAGEAEPDSSD
jgi:hypothetical protein